MAKKQTVTIKNPDRDLDDLKKITEFDREDLCRKQRGEACCPVKK